jgi:hypothetical protein
MDYLLHVSPENITRNQFFCVKLRFFGAFGRLEPDEGKLSRPVLRGGEVGNVLSLPDQGKSP